MASELTITSLQNPRIKEVKRLRESRQRRKSGLFLIDGGKEIAAATASGLQVQSVFCTTDQLENTAILGSLPSGSVNLVAPGVLKRICYGQHDQLPVAVASTPTRSLQELAITGGSRVLVLDRTEKPGNLGACLRTAAACSIDALVLTNPICEPYNPNTIRSSRGAIFQVPVVVSNVDSLISLSTEQQLPILAARVDGERSLWECDLSSGFMAVFGNEADGLLADWRHNAVTPFSIPMHVQTDSLNLSISCAVTLYESCRQRSC
ncbi:MAG: RNA methyltransferase [Aureliella sp.]